MHSFGSAPNSLLYTDAMMRRRRALRLCDVSHACRSLPSERTHRRRQFDVTQQFHHLFWFGDLNYRVDMPFRAACECGMRGTVAGMPHTNPSRGR